MGDAIQFYNRYTQQIEDEAVYGDGFLRFAYQTLPGRALLPFIARNAAFSRWYGWRMAKPKTREKIAPFLKTYGIDPAEFKREPNEFASFNEFFIRELKPGARPVDPDPDAVAFPADGRHLAAPDVSQMESFFVKGQRFDLKALLGGDAKLADRFARGAAVLSRLCPVDYHRFHFPAPCRPPATEVLNGDYFSVNPIALRQRLAYLWENKRTLCRLETERFGLILMLEIGATCVGSIQQTYAPGAETEKGAEKGYFEFGGSSVILLFEPGAVALSADLVEHSAQCREVYAKMGDRMGTAAA
ncbi:MAG: archaetidylserine decarboxylase [Verrucomicrobiales bacterium]